MKPYKGSDQSYDLNCSPNEAKEGGLGPPTCHYTSPHAIFVGVDFRTQSVTGLSKVGPQAFRRGPPKNLFFGNFYLKFF
jgi:hypothetical protein